MKYIRPPEFKGVKEFIKKFRVVETSMLSKILSDDAPKSLDDYMQALKDAIKYAELNFADINKKYTKKALPEAFDEEREKHEGKERTDKEVREILSSKGYKYAGKALSYDTYIELQSATKSAGEGLMRRVNGIIDELKKTKQDIVYNVQQEIIKDLKNGGLLRIEYSNGAMQPLEAYAAMAARSARIETVNIAAIGGALKSGTDYVIMTEMPQCCKYCGAYQGKVYCISGKDKRFPALFETVLKRGYAIPHPNCRHEFIPYFLETESDEEIASAIKNSKIKYDKSGKLKDVRSQRDIEDYAAWQRGNRQLNAEAKEYTQMQSYYADRGETPPYKTIGAFRRERRAKDHSETYQEWRKEYQKLKQGDV